MAVSPKLKILVAGEEITLDDPVCIELKKLGHDVEVADSQTEAIDRPRDLKRQDGSFNGFDLVVCFYFKGG